MPDTQERLAAVEAKLDMVLISLTGVKDTQVDMKKRLDQIDGAKRAIIWFLSAVAGGMAFFTDTFKVFSKG